MRLLIKTGAPRRARAKLEGRESEIYQSLKDGSETLTSLARKYGVSRPTVGRFVKEKFGDGTDTESLEVKAEK